jgi:hypothetical protein
MALTVKDALTQASKDPKFANELITNPGSFQAKYGLTTAQVAQFKALGAAASSLKTGVAGLHGGAAMDYD